MTKDKMSKFIGRHIFIGYDEPPNPKEADSPNVTFSDPSFKLEETFNNFETDSKPITEYTLEVKVIAVHKRISKSKIESEIEKIME